MNNDGEIETLHKPALDYLRNTLGLEVVYHRPDQRSGIERGWPDLTILAPKRPPLLCEFKLAKGQLSAAQKKVHARLKGKGYPVHVVRSYPVFVELISAWHDAGLPSNSPEIPDSSEDRSVLWQHKGWVWKPTTNGRHDKVRKCGPADAHLPQLFGK